MLLEMRAVSPQLRSVGLKIHWPCFTSSDAQPASTVMLTKVPPIKRVLSLRALSINGLGLQALKKRRQENEMTMVLKKKRDFRVNGLGLGCEDRSSRKVKR
jgi:hypothetical protein